MRVILNQDIPTLGPIGAIVTVKDGYARNYLLPRSMANAANEENRKALDAQIKRLEKKRSEVLAEAKALAAKIEKVSVTVAKQVGEEEKIFGSVTTGELEAALTKEGFKISKKDIQILDEIKKVGFYYAQVRLHSEVNAKFKVWVVAEQ